jgi:hypothetical protein
MSLSSLNEFDAKVAKDENLTEVDVRRFRSNIIGMERALGPDDLPLTPTTVTGASAYDEDSWKKIRFEKAVSSVVTTSIFDVSCRTVRYVVCVVSFSLLGAAAALINHTTVAARCLTLTH